MIDISTPNPNHPATAAEDLDVAGRITVRHMHTRPNGTGQWCITVDVADADTDRIFVGKVESWHVDQPTAKTVTDWASKAISQLEISEGYIVLDRDAWDRVAQDGDTTGLGSFTGILPQDESLGQHWVDASTDPNRD